MTEAREDARRLAMTARRASMRPLEDFPRLPSEDSLTGGTEEPAPNYDIPATPESISTRM